MYASQDRSESKSKTPTADSVVPFVGDRVNAGDRDISQQSVAVVGFFRQIDALASQFVGNGHAIPTTLSNPLAPRLVAPVDAVVDALEKLVGQPDRHAVRVVGHGQTTDPL